MSGARPRLNVPTVVELRVPRNIINIQVELIRQQGYRMLRGLELPRQTLDQLGHILAATTTETTASTAAASMVRR